MLPPVEAAILSLALESFTLDPIENVSVNKLKQLEKDCVMMCNGLILLLCQWVVDKTTIPQNEISGLFSIV